MKAIVTGMIATYPVGGVVWDYGQYALGLERMGFEVYYLEDTGWQTYDPRRREYTDDPSYGVGFLAESLGFLSPTLAKRWHFRAMDGMTFGLESAAIEDIAADATVLVNVSGGTLLRDSYMRCRRKLLIDTDPGWNHFRNYPRLDRDPTWGGGHGYRAHDRFFTYAERIGASDCALPQLGLQWHPTRPPVVLDRWQPEPPGSTWTTVMTWANYREPIIHEGISYGAKEREFEHIETLPTRVHVPLEVAVGGQSPPIQHWKQLGWNVAESEAISRRAADYRHYVQASRGEFSVAKNVYAATGSGWFSCRSVCYLAAGRPVVVQDTGFSKVIACEGGIIPFTTLDEAVRGIETVEADYAVHRAGARHMAEQHFAAPKVLGRMLADAGL